MNGTTPPTSANTRSPAKKVVRRRPATTNIFDTATTTRLGLPTAARTNGQVTPGSVAVSNGTPTPPPGANDEVTGFTDPAVLGNQKQYQDYKLVTTKRELLEGLRYHVLDLVDQQQVDIRNTKLFTPPIHLHRRDPRTTIASNRPEDVPEVKDGLNAEQREELSRRKEARKVEREQNLAQIAPAQASRKTAAKLRIKQVYQSTLSEADKRRIQTNYEEKLPWHLEDFDAQHVYVGENQPASSHLHAALVFERSSELFRYVPIEKVYKFAPKKKEVPKMSYEDALRVRRKQEVANHTKWLAGVEDKSEVRRKHNKEQQVARHLYSGANADAKGAGRTGEEADQDFSADELFADDEEGDTNVIKDEDEKLAERRIKEDQLKANYFEVKDEQEYDQEQQESDAEERRRKLGSKKIRKALEKHEHDYNHASDSEYSSSSEESEEERERLEAERRRNLEKGPLVEVSARGGSNANTPSRRLEKKADLLSSGEGRSRKRPGSPNLSDASATDASSRNKKAKTQHLSALQVGSSTGSRAGSPVNVPSSSAPVTLKFRNAAAAGAGSDTDGALSERSRKMKKSKIRDGSSLTHRADSPAVPSRPSSTAPTTSMPSAEEIKDVIRNAAATGGLGVQELIGRVSHPQGMQKDFIQLVKSVARVAEGQNGKKILVLK